MTEKRHLNREEQAAMNRALLASTTPVPDWQPIETAPKDGTQVIFFGRWKGGDMGDGREWPGKGKPCYLIVSWSTIMSNGTGHRWMSGLGGIDSWNVAFTHWQPLPAPPR